MLGVPVILLFTWCVMFMSEIHPSLAIDKCIANSNCRNLPSRNVCCAKSRPKWSSLSSRSQDGCVLSSCVGEPCSSDGDCGGKGECCGILNKCTKYGCSECKSNNDCDFNLYCCKHPYKSDHNVCRRSCIGETCNSDSDCGPSYEYCISRKICWASGLHCRENAHCKGDGECCKGGKCVTQCSWSCSSASHCKSGECCKGGKCVTQCSRSCSSASHCKLGECCKGDKCVTQCPRSCSSASDCKLGECCKYLVCSTSCNGEQYCLSDSDCKGSHKCCKHGYPANVCRTSCVRDHCSSNSDCEGSSNCCKGKNVCRTSCVGEICYSNDDCGYPDEKCNLMTTECEKKDKTLAGWIIAVIVISALAFIFIFCGGCAYCYRAIRNKVITSLFSSR